MLAIIHKKHKDRYRIRFCDESFYSAHLPCFRMWKSLFSPLSNVEKLTAWVVGLSILRRSDWYQGRVKSERCQPPEMVPASAKHPLTLALLFQNTPIKLPRSLDPQTDLYEFISFHKIKALPESALPSLAAIANLTYPVIITAEVPTPVELLTLQISGQRIISLNENTDEWPTTLYSGRDFLGFLIHDLLHAEHFFANPAHRDGQLGVYKFIQHTLTDPGLQTLMNSSEKFREGFEYIISDMNSHPLHLLQTLHSLLFSSLKNDAFAAATWARWIQLAGVKPEEQEALSIVNTPAMQDNHALRLSQLSLAY